MVTRVSWMMNRGLQRTRVEGCSSSVGPGLKNGGSRQPIKKPTLPQQAKKRYDGLTTQTATFQPASSLQPVSGVGDQHARCRVAHVGGDAGQVLGHLQAGSALAADEAQELRIGELQWREEAANLEQPVVQPPAGLYGTEALALAEK